MSIKKERVSYACECGEIFHRTDTFERHQAKCPTIHPPEPEPAKQNDEPQKQTLKIGMDVAEVAYLAQYTVAGIIDRKFKTQLKGFKDQVVKHENQYLRINRGLAEKYDIRIDVAPEYALATQVTIDLALAFADRMGNPYSVAEDKPAPEQLKKESEEVMGRLDNINVDFNY